MSERKIILQRYYIVHLVRACLSFLIIYKCNCYLGNHIQYFQNYLSLILYPCLLISLLLLFGYLVRASSLSLLISLSSYELMIGTFSLGSASCNMLLLFFALSHNRQALRNENPANSTLIENSIIIVFLICSAVNFSAGILHINDSYWKEGSALSKILTNSFYTNHYDFFERIKHSHHDSYESVTLLLAWSQVFLQLIMLPFSFVKYGFLIVRIWGIIFSLLSLIFFQISLLPFFYLMFWVLTLYLPCSYKLEYTFFRNSIRIKQHITAYVLIALFTGASLSLFLKLNKHDQEHSNPVALNSLLQENKTEKYILELSKYFGLIVPNVFNSQDILSNTKWVVIYNIRDSRRNLIPFASTDGSRLSYHLNDIIYYKDSIPIRRCLLANDLNQTMSHLIQVSAYDNRKNEGSRSNLYEFVFFEQLDSNRSRIDTDAELPPVLSRKIDINSYL